MSKVILKKVEKEYPNGYKAVHGIDLEIKDGEFMVLVGPSGCAKSTTLRMIAGLEEISGGVLEIDDKVVNDLPPKDRGIAMVFQNYALYPHMNVYENMAFGLRVLKLPKEEIDSRVKEAAEKLQITDLLNRKPKEMSGGQRQRVAIGRAIVRKPKVFLFDEPLSNLDAKLRVSMRVKIAQLHQELKKEGQSATMIYVTHDQVEAMTMGDRICVMNNGKIMQVDTPINLYNFPKNKFVASFIGSPAMNIVEGDVLKDKEKNFLKLKNDLILEIPESIVDGIENFIGEKVWFGIRPEHIEIVDENEDGEFRIDTIEEMGNEKLIYFGDKNEKFLLRISSEAGRALKIDDKIKVKFNMKKGHLFHYKSQINLKKRGLLQIDNFD